MLPSINSTTKTEKLLESSVGRPSKLPSIASNGIKTVMKMKPKAKASKDSKVSSMGLFLRREASNSSQDPKHSIVRRGSRSEKNPLRHKMSMTKLPDHVNKALSLDDGKVVKENEETKLTSTKRHHHRFKALVMVTLCLCVGRKSTVEREKQRLHEQVKADKIKKDQAEVQKRAQEKQEREKQRSKGKGEPTKAEVTVGRITPFDPNPYMRKKFNGLVPMERTILRKLPQQRSDQEIVVIQDLIARLPCMQQYEVAVQQQLARTLELDELEEGRFVIKQGHNGTSFYIVVSGRLHVTIQNVNKQTGEKEITVLNEMKDGSTFGQIALLHNIKRTASVQCKAPTELLRIDRSDFQRVLKAHELKDWNQRVSCLNWIPAFADWTPQEREKCTQDTKVRAFRPNQIVHGNSTNVTDHICFVVSGECRLVRHVILAKKTYPSGKVTYVLPYSVGTVHDMCDRHEVKKRESEERSRLIRLSTMVPESHFWTIGNLLRGHFFGIGEDMQSTYLIAKTKVEVLFVPRLQFVRTGRTRYIDVMRREVEAAIPSNKQLLNIFAQKRDWLLFKNELLDNIIPRFRRCRINDTNVEDVPWSLRVATPTGFLREFYADKRIRQMHYKDATELLQSESV